MPLVRARQVSSLPAEMSSPADLAAELQHSDPGRRLAAVRAAARAGDVDLLLTTLRTTQDTGLREAVLTGLTRLGGQASIRGIIHHLRSEDVALRNAIIETLQSMGSAVIDDVAPLINDPDADVRIFALNILQGLNTPQVVALATTVLARDPEINVCAAAVEVLAEAPHAESRPALEAALDRFPDQAYYAFAVRMALRRIG